mmetsp:Transcript_49261/g.159675  ORF Transcript_49261/g.159675 Transcript_49261/m.159675 type:complete len:256 (+) Transcript_49261:193-960(+)
MARLLEVDGNLSAGDGFYTSGGGYGGAANQGWGGDGGGQHCRWAANEQEYWTCAGCSTKNWTSRESCRKCSRPRQRRAAPPHSPTHPPPQPSREPPQPSHEPPLATASSGAGWFDDGPSWPSSASSESRKRPQATTGGPGASAAAASAPVPDLRSKVAKTRHVLSDATRCLLEGSRPGSAAAAAARCRGSSSQKSALAGDSPAAESVARMAAGLEKAESNEIAGKTMSSHTPSRCSAARARSSSLNEQTDDTMPL